MERIQFIAMRETQKMNEVRKIRGKEYYALLLLRAV